MSPTDLLDLGYDHPPARHDLAERARRKGRAVRRRRRAVRGVAGLAVAAAAILAVTPLAPWATPGPDGGATGSAAGGATDGLGADDPQQALAGLPVSAGPFGDVAGSHDAGDTVEPLPDQVFDVGWIEGEDQVVYLGQGHYCLGSLAQSDGHLKPAQCMPMTDVPEEGLWGGAVISPPDDRFGEGENAAWIVVGFVRGDVDEVRVHLPEGDLSAHLATSTVPEVGTVYWVATNGFDREGRTSAPAAARDFGEDIWSIQRTVYRDGVPVFHCAGGSCLGTG